MFVASGGSIAPVRIMENFLGEMIDEASFSTPIRILGWNLLPAPGCRFVSFETKIEAEEYAVSNKEDDCAPFVCGASGEDMEGVATIPLIVTTDTAGSRDAILQEIAKMVFPENVRLVVVSQNIGNVSETDIKNALSAKQPALVAFHTGIDPKAYSLAERNDIKIHSFDIIYKLTEWLEDYIKECKPLVEKEVVDGAGKILKIFNNVKGNAVCGLRISEGVIKVNDHIRFMRDEEKIGTGKIKGIQSQKQDVNDVGKGTECGMMIETKADIKEGDRLEAVHTEES